MAKSSNIFSEKDILEIQNKIGELFTEEANEILSINLLKLRNEVNIILNKLKLISVKSTSSNKHKGYRVAYFGKERKKLVAEAYLLIFKIREFLLNESINYRYYFNSNDGQAKVIEFSENDILKYMRTGKFGLQIADSILKKQNTNEQYQSLLDSHYNNLINGIQSAKSSNFKVVHSYIMNKYSDSNPGLRKSNNQYQVFTMGHIFEAIDIAFSEAIENNEIEDFNAIESYMYGKYLNYDSVAGTKGGDNAITMTQIKANAADILDYSTIKKDLEIIQKILEPKTKEELKKDITNLYLSRDKYTTLNEMNMAADNAVEKILSEIKKLDKN